MFLGATALFSSENNRSRTLIASSDPCEKAKRFHRMHFPFGSRCAVLAGCCLIDVLWHGEFRYLCTFIDQEPVGVELPRSRSCPSLGQRPAVRDDRQHAAQAMATYVAELWQRGQTLTGRARMPPVAAPDAEDTESDAEEPVLPYMATEAAAEADMLQTEMGRQETWQEGEQKCDSAAATATSSLQVHNMDTSWPVQVNFFGERVLFVVASSHMVTPHATVRRFRYKPSREDEKSL